MVNDLPGWVDWPLRIVMQVGSLAAVPVAVGAALAARRPRMARDLALAAPGAWFAAKLVKAVVGRGRPGSLLADVIHHGHIDTGLGFPSGHAAVAGALAGAVGPYLGRTGRRVAWGVVLLVALGRLYVGAHLPADVVGGAALGWGCAARALQLFGGSGGVTVCYVLALYTSLLAFHVSVPVLQVTAVYLGAAAVASVAPTPGGLGAMEAALVAGLTAFGAPTAPAIAGVLGFRLVTFWLPTLPGWLVFRRLARHDAI